MARWALEFLILTAARTSEALGATWAEMDLECAIWTIPAERMKAGTEHRVPLCSRAIHILNTVRPWANGKFIFPSRRGDRPMSNMAMSMLVRQMQKPGITVHGFRSTFRDFAAEMKELKPAERKSGHRHFHSLEGAPSAPPW
ncbi:MAG: tyrosine-type recombinase/integrase [Pigmentiphaga sp.]